MLTFLSLLGILLFFMWFGTDHQATKNNSNILWANPSYLYLVWVIIFKKWNKSYFKNNMNLMIYYEEKDDNIPKGYIYINNCTFKEFPNYFKKKFNYFEIITKKNKKYKLYCDQHNYKKWKKIINNNH